MFKDWLWADGLLYSYFKQVLEQRKMEYGLDKLQESHVLTGLFLNFGSN